MLVLGVVGSPRREAGVSFEMVEATLAGAREAGAETATVYLADYDLTPCRHCGGPCFSEGYCEHDREATIALREVVEASDALVLAAPVFMWQPAGLTALFMEKLRLRSGTWNSPARNSRIGLGIAVAGGTGSGVFSALQSIYAWLCLWKFRPLPPMPVIRANQQTALRSAAKAGASLAAGAGEPFRSAGELMAAYDALPQLRYGRVDEYRWLAETMGQALTNRGDSQPANALVNLLAQAERLRGQGDLAGAANVYMRAYHEGMRAW